MRSFGLFLAVVGCSILAALPLYGFPGRHVSDDAELGKVLGAACVGQQNVNSWVCYGSAGNQQSDCTGCGCTLDRFLSGSGSFNSTLAQCNSSPTCTTIFARGSCTGRAY